LGINTTRQKQVADPQKQFFHYPLIFKWLPVSLACESQALPTRNPVKIDLKEMLRKRSVGSNNNLTTFPAQALP
jgi:hypothetical protein